MLTVAQLATRHPAFSQASLRHWIFHSENNGLAASGALIRLGRKILLDEAAFIRWVKSHRACA
jgi:hypothetical protein